MTVHDIAIERATRERYRATYAGREIGVWRVPTCSAARWLIEQGAARREDTLRMLRDGHVSMSGDVGWFADRTVVEHASGTPHFGRWSAPPDWLAIDGCGRNPAPNDVAAAEADLVS